MLYYRYRPYSEISLKELLYSEMYFSSPEECNDPYDSKTFYTFTNSKDRWIKTLKLVLENYHIWIPDMIIDKLADHICKQCPITYHEILSTNLLAGLYAKRAHDTEVINMISEKLTSLLHLYRPPNRYFVSFSKTNSDPLMWSHYADKHKGFCLVFKAVDNSLHQCPSRKKIAFGRKTTNKLLPFISNQIPEKFDFIDIQYASEVDSLDAFINLPVYITGEPESDEEKAKIMAERESHYHQKGIHWKYERESRLILRPPLPWLFGEHFDYSNQERLFHYEPFQLVGIVYGSQMTLTSKIRIKEILNERREWIQSVNYPRIVFDFVEFEAKLSSKERKVEVVPTAIHGLKSYIPADNEFDKSYKDWQDGWGLQIGDKETKMVKIE